MKRREALLRHFDGDRAKMSAYMDIENEFDVLIMFGDWLNDSQTAAREEAYVRQENWFKALKDEVDLDLQEVYKQRSDLELRFVQMGGEWIVQKWLGAEGGAWEKVFENQDVSGNPGPPNAPLEHDEDYQMAR